MRGKQALVALMVPVALLAAGCNASSDTSTSLDQPASGPASGPESGPASGDGATPALDPAYSVDPPGPLEDTLLPPDMLVYSKDALSPETIEAIRNVKGVTNVEPLSLAQVSIEDKVLNLAAVDPGSYRRYTLREGAQTQAVWDRIAAGELAILPELRRKLPIDKAGFLRLGNGTSAKQVHIGAFAPQIPRVDAVVNEKWGQSLGMKMGNAVIVSTGLGLASPQSVREPIQKIAGGNASVQILGPDLDISVQQTAFLVGSVADAVGTFNYTVLGGGLIAPQPSWVATHNATQQVPILGSVTCNKLIFPQLTAALNDIIARGLADKIHPGEYAGCYYPRFIAGTTSLSNHSFGLALDLNTPGNQRGTVGEMDRGVVSAFEKWGFTWGGDWGYTDPMHFEMNRLIEPR